MTKERTYKTLTKSQTSKVRKYTKAGKSQQTIAKLLGVSKQRVSTAQKKVGVGKRVASPFWKQVAQVKKDSGYSHRKATEIVKQYTTWGTKRAAKKVWYTTDKQGKKIRHVGKKWYSPEERSARMRALRQEFEGKELDKELNQELEDVMYGDTPH